MAGQVTNGKLNVGDTIKCLDGNEAVKLMSALEAEDIQSDFLYEKDGQEGYWLVITNTDPVEVLSVSEVKTKICDDYCRYTHGERVKCIENICAQSPLNYLEE